MRAKQAFRRLGRSLWVRYAAFRFINLRVKQLALWLKARNPDTFSGYILHKMAFDKDPRLSMFADKVKAKEYVKDLAGGDYLIKNLVVTTSLRGYSQDDLPRSFVVKANHGCGACGHGQELQRHLDSYFASRRFSEGRRQSLDGWRG